MRNYPIMFEFSFGANGEWQRWPCSSTFAHWVITACSWVPLTIEARWFRLWPELDANRMIPRCLFGEWITGNPHTTQPLINQLHWWTCGDIVIGYDWDLNPRPFDPGPNVLTTQPRISIVKCKEQEFLIVKIIFFTFSLMPSHCPNFRKRWKICKKRCSTSQQI
jgi:hypothetical protein